MAAPENSRHYYEHPSHGVRERTIEATDYYMSTVHGIDPSSSNHHPPPPAPSRPDAAVDPHAADAFYRTKLHEGFVDLRNSYKHRNNQTHKPPSQSHPHTHLPPTEYYPPSQPVQSNGQHYQPRNKLNTEDYNQQAPRPISMHATPGHSVYDSSHRNYDYNTVSSRGSADSYPDMSSYHPHQHQQPLFRSSSDLQLDNMNEAGLRRDFGSADVLEARQMAGHGADRDADFFAMLRNYKSDNPDQRAPPPPGIQNVLRGEHVQGSGNGSAPIRDPRVHNSGDPLHHTHGNDNITAPPNHNHHSHARQSSFSSSNQNINGMALPPASSSNPQSSVDFIKRSPKPQKKARPRSGDVSALLRRFTKPTKGEGNSNGGEMGHGRSIDSGNSSDTQITDLLTRILPAERLRKKAFVHFDCQSVGINFVEAASNRQTTQQGNMKTGASAASHLDELADPPPASSDQFCRNSNLVCQCAAFINELGGEEERNVTLSGATAQRKVKQYIGGQMEASCDLDLHQPPMCNGISILEGLPGADNRHSLLEKHKGKYVLEYRDRGCMYYRQHFRHMEHHNYFGIDENVGPVAISIKREKIIPNSRLTDPYPQHSQSNDSKHNAELSPTHQYRVIVRTSELHVLRGTIIEDALPSAARLTNSSRGLPAKDIIEYVAPEIQLSCLKQAVSDEKTKDQLLALDEQGRAENYKVGIMYCKCGQSTEEEMYNNEFGGPAFIEFLDLIGQQRRLKGFDKFKGGLDNKTDTTGKYSYYTTCQAYEIMFHVSTLLPFENNRQQLLRKRHIGNDIVTVVFQEPGSLPFDITSVRSQFQHVFIIVRVHDPNTDHTSYSVAVTRSKDVPAFGPPITQSKYQHGPEFADFLIAKILNAENAAHLSDKFQAMAVRTRGEYMKDLANNYVTNTSLEHSSKLGKFSLNVGGGKKKDKKTARVIPDIFARGGISWLTQLEDFGQSTVIDVHLVISADILAVICKDSTEVIFTCWCSSVLGWTSNYSPSDPNLGSVLRIYFNTGDCIVVKPVDHDDSLEIMDRLRIVTPGAETDEMVLRRNDIGQLGFHVHTEGLVSDVEPNGTAYKAGLRNGSRLVEICKIASTTLTHEQMIDLLRTTASVPVVVIPPHTDGKPRRSLEERTSDYYMLYPTTADDSNTSTYRPRPTQPIIDGEESSAYFSDDEHSPQGTVMSVAKRVNTVTLRSSSSGGSSCSPGSTLSGKHRHDRRGGPPSSDTERYSHPCNRSQDQTYSDAESGTQRRPPSGPVYTPSQASNHYAQGGSYYDNHKSSNNDPHNRSAPASGVKRTGKDWHLKGPMPFKATNQDRAYSKRGQPQHYHSSSGSQELLDNSMHDSQDLTSRGTRDPSLDRYSGNKALNRTLSDESLHSTNRRYPDGGGNYYNSNKSSPRRSSQDMALVRPSNHRQLNMCTHGPPQGGATSTDEDLDWNKLVSTASKAVSDSKGSSSGGAALSSRSHDSSTDKDNGSILSGQSTPTQDKNKDLELRCSRLERDLRSERRKVADLERRLQLEKNLREDMNKELDQIKKENQHLRHESTKLKSKMSKFTDEFFKASDGPESAT